MTFSFSFNFPKTVNIKHVMGCALLAFLCTSHFVSADVNCEYVSDPFCIDEIDVTGYRTDSDYWHYNTQIPGFFPSIPGKIYPGNVTNSVPINPKNNHAALPPKPQSVPTVNTVKENVLQQSTLPHSVEHTCHPVTISTGSKFLDELDFQDVGENPLKIDRHYTAGTYGIFGYGWTTSMDDRLEFGFQKIWNNRLSSSGSELAVCMVLPGLSSKNCVGQLADKLKTETFFNSYSANPYSVSLNHSAQLIRFVSVGSNPIDIGGSIVNSDGASLSRPDGSTWKVLFPNGDVEIFNNDGLPITKTNVNGIGWTFSFDDTNFHRLLSVTHTSGKKLVLGWANNDSNTSQVTSVTDPNGFFTGYKPSIFASNSFGAMGTVGTVTYPKNSGVRKYTYITDVKAPTVPLVTGIYIDEIQHTSYTYYPMDSLGRIRVSSSGLVDGVEKSSFSYTASTSIVTNALGATTTYTYDGALSLKAVSRPSSGACPYAADVSYNYGSSDPRNVSSKTDWKGNVTSYTYYPSPAPSGTVQTETDSATGITKSYEWDSYSRLTKLTRKTNEGTTLTTSNTYYGSAKYNRLASTSTDDGLGNIRTISYDYTFLSNGLIKAQTVKGARTDIANDITTYNYNDRGDLISVVDAAGNSTQYIYDTTTFDRPNSIIDANGLRTYFSYDGKYRISNTNVTDGSSSYKSTFAYNGLDKLTSATSPDARNIAYVYNAAGQLSTATELSDQSGIYDQTVFNYDLLNNLTSSQHKYNKNYTVFVTENTCNSTQNNGYCYSFAMNCSSSGKKVVSGSGYIQCGHDEIPTTVDINSPKKTYDINGNLQFVAGGLGQKLTYTYNDKNVNLTSIVDALGNTTQFDYTADNLIKTITDPLSGVTSYSYDSFRNLQTVSDPTFRSTIYNRNNFGGIINGFSPDAGMITNTYYDTGALKTTKFATYYRDALGRVTQVKTNIPYDSQYFVYDVYSDPNGSCTNGKGHLCAVKDSSGSVTYAYTPFGKLSRQTTYVGENYSTYNISYAYDSAGRLFTETYPNGVVIRYGYNVQSRVNKIDALVNGTWMNVLNFATLPGAEVTTFGNAIATKVIHDLDGRITDIQSSNNGLMATNIVQNLHYVYDTTNQITSITNAVNTTASQTYTYDGKSQLKTVTSGLGNETFTYDANGNRRTHSTATISETYNYRPESNRLVSISTPTLITSYQSDTNGNTTSIDYGGHAGYSYTYDSLGRMNTLSGVGTSQTYIYNALNQRVAKRNNRTIYLYDTDNVLRAETSVNMNTINSVYVYLEGKIVGLIRGGQLYFIHSDYLGRPEVVTNSAQSIVWRANNAAFKRDVSIDYIGGLNIGFPGQYFDSESGFWYNLNRYYNPATGRYLQSDPIGLKGGLNTYAYVLNNPVLNTDPMGLETPDISQGRMPNAQIPNTRLPDFVQFSLDIYAVNFTGTFTRSGHAFIGPGFTAPNSGTMNSNGTIGASASIAVGYLNKACPSNDEVDGFVGDLGYGGAKFFRGIGGGLAWSPGQGTATVFGFGMGGSYSPGSLQYDQGATGLGGW